MLRDYQAAAKARIYEEWNAGHKVVMVTQPTGAGKTVLVGNILKELSWHSCVVAHRQELVSQLALALNREQVPHGIIAPNEVIRQITALQIETHGKTYFNPRAACRVASVHTLAARQKSADKWFSQVQLIVIDEGHHVLKANIWGETLELFPNSRGLFVTAHAVRADGRGLGRDADGLVDTLIVGPSCRSLIDRGFLTDYRLIAPPSDVDVSSVPIGATGDFSAPQLRKAIHASKTIVGDVAKHYIRFTPGKLGVTFAVDIESAGEIAQAYKKVGVRAEVITAKTPIHVRAQLMRQFRARDILQLVSVDVLGEGVDVPAIEVVTMARHTASFQWYAQMTGRGLRVMVDDAYAASWGDYSDDERKAVIAASVKPRAVIIDHVNNWQRHGLPDMKQDYSLLRREKRGRAVAPTTLRRCLECMQLSEAYLSTCPHCGAVRPPPAGRGSPQMVEGDLVELDPEVLQALRDKVDGVDSAAKIPYGIDPIIAKAILRRHDEKQNAQRSLRRTMAVWGGYQKLHGHDDRELQRLFFQRYGVDVLTAHTLGSTDAAELQLRLTTFLESNNIVEKHDSHH